jgi:uncharacterized protein YjbI with pentapeptide repeats
MDRDEAIELLKGRGSGINEWNQRRQSGEEIPVLSSTNFRKADLRDADLNGASLAWADLSGADLSGVNLLKANLSGANLSGANLNESDLNYARLNRAIFGEADLFRAQVRKANLTEADLTAAKLREADFREADLTGVKLNGAILSRANLSGAQLAMADFSAATFDNTHLRGADFSRAKFSRTVLAGVDLSDVRGLDSVRHVGPSTLGTDTLFRSKGNIPETFLRGCGVPDSVIVNRYALIGATQPIQFYSCFISYSAKDEDFAKHLHSKMREEGLRAWFAPENMQGGKKLHEQVDEAIKVFDKLLLVLSPNSINSKWVRDEIRRARTAEVSENRRKLFPIRLVDYKEIEQWKSFYADLAEDVAEEIREYFIPDFSNWKDHESFVESFARLLRDLKSEESTGRKPTS